MTRFWRDQASHFWTLWLSMVLLPAARRFATIGRAAASRETARYAGASLLLKLVLLPLAWMVLVLGLPSAGMQVYVNRAGTWKSDGRNPLPTYGAYGTYKPTTANTGLPSGWTPTTTVTTAFTAASNTTYTNYEFQHWVDANNCVNTKFVTCKFRGPPAGDVTLNKRIVEVHGSSASNVQFFDCHFEPYDRTIQGWATGLGGHDFKVYRCRFEGAIDQIDIYSFDGSIANAEIYGNLFQNLDCFYPATDHADGNHSDHIQITNGSHIIIVGNTMTGLLDSTYGNQGTGGGTPYFPQANASIQVNQSSGSAPHTVADVLIDRNWIDGGSQGSINMTENGNGAMVSFRITNNKAGRSGRVASQTGAMAHAMFNYFIVSDQATATKALGSWAFTGNVYEDNGAAVVLH